MSEPFIGEIRIMANNFAPRGWAFCNGQTLPIAQNTALFSILGTTYGGDGRTTLGLPNLQGRAPMHPGRGPGLTTRRLGEKTGVSEVVLSDTQIPAHDHTAYAQGRFSNQQAPGGNWLAVPGDGKYAPANNLVSLDSAAIGSFGGGQAHENKQPYLALNFVIALVGLFPSRS